MPNPLSQQSKPRSEDIVHLSCKVDRGDFAIVDKEIDLRSVIVNAYCL